tara:strand:+ start:1270 stop:1812 length:543 start_codon:yes stop_codon:yes gene_type:complete
MFYQVLRNDSDFMMPYFDPDEVEDKRGDDDFILLTRPIRYSEGWVPLELKFSMDDSLPVIPSISTWLNYLVLHESAYSELKDLLAAFGEFLPCQHQGSKFYLFNPLTIAEDLDAIVPGSVTRKSELLSGIRFDEKKLEGVPVFRSKESYITIYCSQIFKKAVEDADLQGLLFNPNLTHYW